MKDLNKAEILSIQRLKQKGLQLYEIADRIGITVEDVKFVLKKGLSILDKTPNQ